MTSDAPREAFVWIWLPEATVPVVAGRIERRDGLYAFNYGRSYLEHPDARAIFAPELPLQGGIMEPTPPMAMASCLRDGSPDAWGRRVIINRLTGLAGQAARAVEFDELTFMLASGSDRAGAIDFQASPTQYVARQEAEASLDQLVAAAELVEAGMPLPPAMAQALFHGSSMGGARPKALITGGDRKMIAKFSATADTYSVVGAEFVAMRLARLAGLDVAPVELMTVSGRQVLLVERFDRRLSAAGWERRMMVSALTILRLDEMQARYASYGELADSVRKDFSQPRQTLRELYGRMVFNILCGNTDDHARNHAAFTDRDLLALTPAYDICPQSRTGREASLAMSIDGQDRRAQLTVCRTAAARFQLTDEQACKMIDDQIATVRANWDAVCDEAGLSAVDRAYLWGRQFLNEYALEGYGRV